MLHPFHEQAFFLSRPNNTPNVSPTIVNRAQQNNTNINAHAQRLSAVFASVSKPDEAIDVAGLFSCRPLKASLITTRGV
jgi:hypothetical protein